MKVIFFDIDGTLINFGGDFPESAKTALKLAKSWGHKIILCTGRSKCQVEDRLLDFGFDGMVCAAGAYVEYHDEPVYTSYLSEAMVNNMVSYLKDNKMVFMLQCTDKIVSTNGLFKAMLKDFMKSGRIKMPKNISQIFKFQKADDNLFNNAANYKNVEKACYYDATLSLEEVKAGLGSEYDVTAMSFKSERGGSGGITAAGITKAYGMEKLIEHLGVSREDTIAFGDGPNDFEMIEFAGIGVAMGNASDDLKKKADMVTTAIDKDGIFNGMKELGLI